MPIPDALRATVLQRLFRLAPAERRILTQAAAIGRNVELDVLAAVAGRSIPSVHAIMERAADLQLVRQRAPNRYSFRHAMTCDIIYAESFNAAARTLHRRIACVLERLRGRSRAALADLAYHAWAGGDPARTLRYNELAGDGAAAVHARDDARQFYTRARSFINIDSPDFARVTAKLQSLNGSLHK